MKRLQEEQEESRQQAEMEEWREQHQARTISQAKVQSRGTHEGMRHDSRASSEYPDEHDRRLQMAALAPRFFHGSPPAGCPKATPSSKRRCSGLCSLTAFSWRFSSFGNAPSGSVQHPFACKDTVSPLRANRRGIDKGLRHNSTSCTVRLWSLELKSLTNTNTPTEADCD